MQWIVIKKGTNGDTSAPAIEDSRIQDDFVAAQRAANVLYKGYTKVTIKTLFNFYTVGNFIQIGTSYYQILSIDNSDFPFSQLELRELV